MEKFMALAIKEARKGAMAKDCGPFGAVVVKNGKAISRAHNKVVKGNDPTSHAEINAIRAACRKLRTFSLQGCAIYSTCEPCPMCLAAIHWARIGRIIYGATRKDAAAIGFDDNEIYEMFKACGKGKPKLAQQSREECLAPMKEWDKKQGKVRY